MAMASPKPAKKYKIEVCVFIYIFHQASSTKECASAPSVTLTWMLLSLERQSYPADMHFT
jgi:hypothetical protein